MAPTGDSQVPRAKTQLTQKITVFSGEDSVPQKTITKPSKPGNIPSVIFLHTQSKVEQSGRNEHSQGNTKSKAIKIKQTKTKSKYIRGNDLVCHVCYMTHVYSMGSSFGLLYTDHHGFFFFFQTLD